MATYLSKPAIYLPPHQISREELLADMEARHPDHPRLRSLRRIVGEKMPTQRQFSQPLDVVLADRDIAERNATAFADVRDMGVRAARAVLAEHDVLPEQVDCVITSHSTGDAVPGLDAHLIFDLGLRPNVSRTAMSQLGCAGGAHGIVKAHDYLLARPGSTALVVVAESLSSIYHHGDTGIEMMMYKALWGDSGAALLVSDRPLGPGLEVVDTWEYLLPDSTGRYRKRLDEQGVHFDSDKSATDSVKDMAPALRKWLEQPTASDPESGPWPLDFIVAHTGGPAILDDLRDELGLPEEALAHSRASLDEVGNLGGASVIDVLDRTYATPPAAGSHGLLIGFGPGFSVSAAKVRRRA